MESKTLTEWADAIDNEKPWRPSVAQVADALREYASLLAAVESSGDEIVRKLVDREPCYPNRELEIKAAARITLDAQEKAALKADLASVKARAEAMESLLLLALWHHQGGSSPVGQPIRKLLGIGQHAYMTDEQIERATAAGRAAHPKE